MALPFHGIFSALNQPRNPSALPLSQEEEGSGLGPSASASNQTGRVAVDIYEQDGFYIIRAPIAGVKLSELDIEVDGSVVTIRGRRVLTDASPPDQYYVQECFWGEFARSVTLPMVVDPKKVRATFSKDGILKVLIPKEEKVKIVRISEG